MHPDWPEARKRLEEACHTFNPMKVWERDFATTSLTPAWDACAADIRLALSLTDRIDALEAALRKAEWHIAARLQEMHDRRASDKECGEAADALVKVRAALSSPSAQEPTA